MGAWAPWEGEGCSSYGLKELKGLSSLGRAPRGGGGGGGACGRGIAPVNKGYSVVSQTVAYMPQLPLFARVSTNDGYYERASETKRQTGCRDQSTGAIALALYENASQRS